MEALLFDWPISSPSSWVISNETTSEGDWNLNFFFVGSELFLRVASRFWWIMINCCDWSCCEYVIHPSRVLVYKTTRCFGLRSSREEEVEDQQKVKPEKNESRKNLTIPIAHTRQLESKNWISIFWRNHRQPAVKNIIPNQGLGLLAMRTYIPLFTRWILAAMIVFISFTARLFKVTFRVTTNNERASRSAK